MKTITLFSFCLIFCLLNSIPVWAQITRGDIPESPDVTVEVILLNNTRHTGNVISANDDELELRTDSGRIFIEFSSIRSIRELDPTRRTASWFENPNTSRLFFSPTARPLNKGDGYYQNIYVFFNNFAYAVTDNIALTAGFSLVPGVRLGNQLYLISGKFGYEVSENNYIGAGVGAASVDGFDNGLVLGYANYTRAFQRASLTGGITGFSVDDEAGTYAFYAGGDYRLWQRIAFVTENFYFPEADDGLVVSYGLRFMGERISFDLAWFRPGLGSGMGVGIPYVDVVFNF